MTVILNLDEETIGCIARDDNRTVIAAFHNGGIDREVQTERGGIQIVTRRAVRKEDGLYVDGKSGCPYDRREGRGSGRRRKLRG